MQTPEERRAAHRERERRRRAAMTDEERAAKREQDRQYRIANREALSERQRQRRANRTDEERAAMRERDRQYRRECPDQRAATVQRYYAKHGDAIRQRKAGQARARYRRDRAAVFAHYGQACACCGAAERLTIDHVNGDGAEHHKTAPASTMYRWLVRNGFPSGYQVLCFPCNRSKGTGKACRIKHPAAA